MELERATPTLHTPSSATRQVRAEPTYHAFESPSPRPAVSAGCRPSPAGYCVTQTAKLERKERKGPPTFWNLGNVGGRQRQLVQDPLSPILDGRAVEKSREIGSSGSEKLWSGTFT